MATTRDTINELPLELHNGDRMTQEEFHRIYEQMPENFRAELIGGIVYVASPLKRPHSKHHLRLGSVFDAYQGYTLGVDAGDNATIILGKKDEPQPDLYLRILPEYGGRSRDTVDEFIKGATELLAEIAHSSRSIDLNAKLELYKTAGVLEYIVVCVKPRRLYWFDLKTGKELTPDADGIVKSVVFPGLWIHADALLDLDYPRLIADLQQGLATPEHAAFVAGLAATRKPSSGESST